MPATGAEEFAALAKRLKAAGETGLRTQLYKAINDSVRPLGAEIRSVSHLNPYLPDRYAAVLSGDLAVTTSKRTGADAGVRLIAKGRVKRRKVILLNNGLIQHPLFGNRKRWYTQARGMNAGFFDDPVHRAAPRIRSAVKSAMDDVRRQIEKG